MDLPRGKFNRADNLEPSDSNLTEKSESLNVVPFVKSATGLPGTIEKEDGKENLDQCEMGQSYEEIRHSEGNKQKLGTSMKTNSFTVGINEDVGELTTELVEKMEHFNVGQEKISTMKTIAIKLEVRFTLTI